MDEKQLLHRIGQSTQKQVKYARWQCIFSGVAAACCVVALLLVCALAPRVVSAVERVDGVMADLEEVTGELAGLDLENFVSDSMEQLNSIDFAALNQAIADLADVVEPLAKFFNAFN